MSSSTETNEEKGGTNNASNKHDPKINTTIAATSNKDPPKKKRPIQHLLAGGTAGFVESSICHPLDTIKTRMQLRRQNTLRSRALTSLRDVAGNNDRGALHRTAGDGTATGATSTTTTVDATKAAVDGLKSSATKNETVRVKPDVVKTAKSATIAKPQNNVLHDVGWKQRLPTASKAATETASSITNAAASTVTKSAASAASSSSTGNIVVAPLGPFGTARRIVEREGPLALYKGLTAVYTGIVPKMAIRFVSFEYYRDVLGGWYGQYFGGASSSTTNNIQMDTIYTPPPSVTFFAGLLSGLTEAILIVTPAEVCKIRMQSQYHSLMDPSQMTHIKYRNVAQTAALVVKEEGIGALYKGVVPTMLRQGCNQAVNFTVYNWSKKKLLAWKKKREEEKTGGNGSDVQLEHWQTLLLGGLSGGMGPLVNNPLDVVKTRMQKQVIYPGKEPKYKSLLQSCIVIAKEEGTPALWKGITPRLMRIMPGQAITFMTYEAVSAQMEKYGLFD
mmetsp:Transcript_6529/g.14769  ORF Transcript_6529/g.14769 Transcript_6529/m.14769 type:complete len:504 (+) Transcript_6529:528-2039(+)|eukprot:CAMPEP_0172329304 /NCGR_PEP_ID=MMETSP1058-20130122/60814_1 /TAXON_ID=83371 /ORGANISM="Detonula confervacea, Strain CCMP 353" /LENGTH=503 /DNA_ID=CAMNT_0013046475 /DNA_START=605 /DNA_END=2116 /DNA_ORIENTATION=-